MEQTRNSDKYLDVVIVGGGPAGLSAALLLGRCVRNVLVCDAGHPRNAPSLAMHGFLGNDGVSPKQFLQRARADLDRYECVSFLETTVNNIDRKGIGFVIHCDNGNSYFARSVLLATGLIDKLPSIPGAERFYGVSLHHCPYCDAWEHRDQRIGVLGKDQSAVDLALELALWSQKIVLYTNDDELPKPTSVARLKSSGIQVVGGVIESLEGSGGQIEQVVLKNDGAIACDALFFSPDQAQHTQLAQRLGCVLDRSTDTVITGSDGCTAVQGLFVAGNASKGLQMAMIAAAEGLKAAAAINEWLLEADESYLARIASKDACF